MWTFSMKLLTRIYFFFQYNRSLWSVSSFSFHPDSNSFHPDSNSFTWHPVNILLILALGYVRLFCYHDILTFQYKWHIYYTRGDQWQFTGIWTSFIFLWHIYELATYTRVVRCILRYESDEHEQMKLGAGKVKY